MIFQNFQESIVIVLDNTSYRIFITDDIVTCAFYAEKTGHVSSPCMTIYTAFLPTENMETSNEQTTAISSSQHIVEKTNSINVTSDLHLDNSTHLTAERTSDNSEISN